jgi:hypothetical protein
VVVFRCPRKNWTEVLRELYSELDKQRLSLMPHYTIRSFDASTDSLWISFRILRKKEDEAAIASLLEKFLKEYQHEIDPKESSPLSQYHEWRDIAGWTKNRCEILSKISRFVLEIINADTKMEDRLQWDHLFANMELIFQVKGVVRTPETYPNDYYYECK